MNKKVRDELTDRLREYAAAAWSKVRRLFAPAKPPNFEESEGYIERLEYYRKFEPVRSDDENEKVDYSPVVDWSKELWSALERTETALDEKADAVVKYLGGGTALLSLGVLFGVKLDTSRASLFALITLASAAPAILCAIRAISFAIAGRNPSESATLTKLDKAIEIANYYKKKEYIEINLWLMLHPVSYVLLQRNGYKAELVQKAYLYYERALKLLVIPFVAFLGCLTFYVVQGDGKPAIPSITVNVIDGKASSPP
jgi:hypothetical protein